MSARLLVLEDDAQLRNVMETVLKSQGYDVQTASSGQEAVKLTLQAPFDLIIADIRMDGMDGLEALRQAKESQPEVGSLVVSGYASPDDTARAEALEVGGYLKKPIKMNVLLEHVQRVLAHRVKESQTQKKSSLDRECLLWSLETTLDVSDRSGEVGPVGWLAEVRNLAIRLSRQFEVVPEVARELSAAAGLHALLRARDTEPPEFLRQSSLLKTFRVIWMDGVEDTPFESALVRLTTLACEGLREVGQWPTGQQLEEKFPGQFPRMLIEAYQSVHADEPVPLPIGISESQTAGVSAFSLAQALERGGDHKGAEEAYLQIAQAQMKTRTGVRALLRVGPLLAASARLEEAFKLMEKAQDWALRLGPVLHSQALLEMGLLRSQGNQKDRAVKEIREALGSLRHLGLWPSWSRGLLGLHSLGVPIENPQSERFLKLVQAPHSEILRTNLSQALPLLLELAQGDGYPAAVEVLARTALTSSKLFVRDLSGLDEGQRILLVEVLLRSGLSFPDELRRHLQADSSKEVQSLGRQLPRCEGREEQISFRFYSLGMFQVFRGEENVPDSAFRTQKNKYLLANIVGESGRARSLEALIEDIWPNKEAQKGRYSLNWALGKIRACLQIPGSKVIVRQGPTLLVDPKIDWWHDLDELGKAVAAGRQADKAGDLDLAAAAYRRASELYQGQYLEGCYLDWAINRRERTNQVMSEVFMRLTTINKERGDFEQALAAISQVLELQPHFQKAHLEMITVLTEAGRPEEAIRHYRKCEELLRVEYDIEPSTEILRAYHEARLRL